MEPVRSYLRFGSRLVLVSARRASSSTTKDVPILCQLYILISKLKLSYQGHARACDPPALRDPWRLSTAVEADNKIEYDKKIKFTRGRGYYNMI